MHNVRNTTAPKQRSASLRSALDLRIPEDPEPKLQEIQRFRSRPLIEAAHFALRKIVEKEIDRSNATVAGDDKIGSRVSWWFAGSARYPSNPSGIT
jgi:hypothetical protein